MMDKVTNPETGYSIGVDGKVFKRLLKKGYTCEQLLGEAPKQQKGEDQQTFPDQHHYHFYQQSRLGTIKGDWLHLDVPNAQQVVQQWLEDYLQMVALMAFRRWGQWTDHPIGGVQFVDDDFLQAMFWGYDWGHPTKEIDAYQPQIVQGSRLARFLMRQLKTRMRHRGELDQSIRIEKSQYVTDNRIKLMAWLVERWVEALTQGSTQLSHPYQNLNPKEVKVWLQSTITPPHGWNANQVAEVAMSDHFPRTDIVSDLADVLSNLSMNNTGSSLGHTPRNGDED